MLTDEQLLEYIVEAATMNERIEYGEAEGYRLSASVYEALRAADRKARRARVVLLGRISKMRGIVTAAKRYSAARLARLAQGLDPDSTADAMALHASLRTQRSPRRKALAER